MTASDPEASDPVAAFIDAACVPLDGLHSTGTLERAEAILAANPEVATRNVHTAAILGDEAVVRRMLTSDPANATEKGGPRGWDALTHLCFSRYLRLDRTRSRGFVEAARALLEGGASAGTGFYSDDQQPPVFECALYGAAGVAHHAELTRLLIERGADPNDDEVAYHAPETYDNAALKILVGTGKLTAESLTCMLIRKHDWHDRDGVEWLLEHGADPNRRSRWGWTPLEHALRRDNAIEIIELLVDHGANPTLDAGVSAAALAARGGRGDVLELLRSYDIPIELRGLDRLLAACARNDAAAIRSLAGADPKVVTALRAQGGRLLVRFAGIGNTDGVRSLLDLGVDVGARLGDSDPYWDLTNDTTALHVAAWRARHATVRLLIERGARIEARDGNGRTPLALAVRACVDSYWAARRSPESVAALLEAGASIDGIDVPTGYAAIDALLERKAGA